MFSLNQVNYFKIENWISYSLNMQAPFQRLGSEYVLIIQIFEILHVVFST